MLRAVEGRSVAPAASDYNIRSAWQGDEPRWLRRLRSVQSRTMLAFGRLLVALFTLLSVQLDPSQPSGHEAITYGLIYAYIVFALAAFAVPNIIENRISTEIAAYSVDLLFFSLLLHLTDGPASPFFVYFTFILFSGTIRWGWRGALATTVANVVIYVTLSFVAAVDFWLHADLLIVRTSYLIGAGIAFCYLAAVLEHSRLRLARLAAWPAKNEGAAEHPSLEPILAHAAGVLSLSRLVVVWEQDGHRGLAMFSKGKSNLLVAEHYVAWEPSSVPCLLRSPDVEEVRRSLPEAMRWAANKEQGASVPLTGHGVNGALAVISARRIGRDFLPLASIVAIRIAAELEGHRLRRRLASEVATAERARLAQDIHDDMLQALTAMALRLKAVERDLPAKKAREIAATRELLAQQQRRLRMLLSDWLSQPESMNSFHSRLTAIARSLEALWSCHIELSLAPQEPVLREPTVRSIEHLLSEVVANGMRHGRADRFVIEQRISGNTIELLVRDNGTGIPQAHGSYEHDTIFRHEIGSASLRNRIATLGWRIRLETSDEGTTIAVQIPL